MNKVFKVLPLALLISGAVHAATDNPWYVGARVGGTTFDNLDGVIKGQNADKDDWGGGVFVGYNFNSWFGLEGGYTYLGQADYGSDGFEVQGIDLVGKFTYEMTESFDLYGKLGGFVAFVDNDNVNDDNNNLAGTAGVGVEYFFNNDLSARAEYQYYNQVGKTESPGQSDVHFYGLSLVYHWGAPAPVPVIEPEPEPMPEPVPEVVKVEAVGAALPFAFDSDDLTQEDIDLLQPVAQQLVKYPDTQLYVVGHTDSRGTLEYNQKLSEERAAVVAGYVGQYFGIDKNRIVAQGRGELEPVASNDTDEGRAQNRRVEVFVPGFEMNQ
ncbi:outer membrane beta-barrel protein [Photobacterium sp. DNB23_23_1]|uniref:Outer membrane beta-barrel protein n=1 Tax=Photobacterium pectinilyticum TaxID=2906793 RepID=A0ABT1N3D2_9GAMM|nr:OmpA family protein [Photobacterium sp. ZSDE20]MCQ1059242.1 outer membrane beta-barrel protein [Photobacterium sp. ZSDE20]MDD1824525.1 outer membrane beta-barrel protein [Photobacterium sp. ZSDE20]